MSDSRPRLVFTTDVNGTTTPANTFGLLVRPFGTEAEMARLMADYTTGRAGFAGVLPEMRRLAAVVDRKRLLDVARSLAFFPGAAEVLSRISSSASVNALAALSTTGFAGLMALLNTLRHGGLLKVAASPVLAELLTDSEKSALIRPILAESHKTLVLDELVRAHDPHPGLVFHVGDTLGDFDGIRHAAETGGLGIAFNPNAPLAERLGDLPLSTRRNIRLLVFSPGISPDYNEVGHAVSERLWEICRTEL